MTHGENAKYTEKILTITIVTNKDDQEIRRIAVKWGWIGCSGEEIGQVIKPIGIDVPKNTKASSGKGRRFGRRSSRR